MHFIFLALIFSGYSQAQTATVDCKMSPAGSFQLVSKEVKGFAVKTKTGVAASKILVGLKHIETGMSLRNQHAMKRLLVDKFPDAVLLNAIGAGGKGQGEIQIKGIKKPIAGTYEVSGNKLTAKFPLKLSDFEIKDVKYVSVGVDDEVQVAVTVPLKDK